jgi:hypothetical protein
LDPELLRRAVTAVLPDRRVVEAFLLDLASLVEELADGHRAGRREHVVAAECSTTRARGGILEREGENQPDHGRAPFQA